MGPTPNSGVIGVIFVVIATCSTGCGDDSRRTATPTPVPPTSTPTALATVTATSTSLSTATATEGVPTPTSTPAAMCSDRTGGALVTFEICQQTLTVWSTAPAFIDEALALLASGDQRIPVFGTLLDGMDCDPDWSWHVEPMDMSFADLAIELCDGCPSHIEDDKTYWIETVGQYCPWTARVTAVDDRRGAP